MHIAPCTLHAWAWASKRRSQRAAAVQAGRANTAPTRTEPSNSPQPALQPIAAEQTDCTSTELHLRSNMQFPCATQRGAKQAREGGKLKCESSAKDMGEQNFHYFTAYYGTCIRVLERWHCQAGADAVASAVAKATYKTSKRKNGIGHATASATANERVSCD